VSTARFSVIVVGGGIAGFEALLRLRRLGGHRLDVTLLSPVDELVYEPRTVLAPFTSVRPRRYPVRELAADIGVRWVQDRLDWVDRDGHVVHTGSGRAVHYDALLLALGAHRRPPIHGSFEPGFVLAFSDRTAESYRQIVDRAIAGEITTLLFAAPVGPGWPLPLYELALLTAARLRDAGRTTDLAVAIPEHRPLAAFGGDAGTIVAGLLREAGIAIYSDTTLEDGGATAVRLRPSGTVLHPDRVIMLPRITGPDVRGIPGGGHERFLEVDAYCRVVGTDGHVFAAGDATHYPVKQGGVGAQQADTAAAGIAHLAGLAAPPAPLRPVVQGVLLTGAAPRYLTAHVIATHDWEATLTRSAPWPVDEKIVARELGRYLARWDGRLSPVGQR
jgi:sulfide:quinone oxidoreductase